MIETSQMNLRNFYLNSDSSIKLFKIDESLVLLTEIF